MGLGSKNLAFRGIYGALTTLPRGPSKQRNQRSRRILVRHCGSFVFFICSRREYLWRGRALGCAAAAGQIARFEIDARRPISRVLCPGRAGGPAPPQRRPFIWDVRRRTPRATDPDSGSKTARSVISRRRSRACCPYLVLLPVGFALPHPLPDVRCALTAPFHPCRFRCRNRRYVSVALSLGSPPPGVTRHRVSVEPGLSSPAPIVADRRKAAT